jgi:hypothetical protein
MPRPAVFRSVMREGGTDSLFRHWGFLIALLLWVLVLLFLMIETDVLSVGRETSFLVRGSLLPWSVPEK